MTISHVEQALRDVAADEGMSRGDYEEHRADYEAFLNALDAGQPVGTQLDVEDYYDSLAEAEAERHGHPHVDRPCRDAIIKRRMRMADYANKVLGDAAAFNSTGDLRIDELGWCDGPMTSDADFTPKEEGF